MKALISSLMMLTVALGASAQGIRVYKSNGEVETYLNADLDSIVAFHSEREGRVAIDLGLSVKWAETNIGADSASHAGSYFAWGEVEPKGEYTEDGNAYVHLSYQSLNLRGVTDKHGNLTAAYDVARRLWGGTWRMPTSVEMNELRTRCKWVWTEIDGRYGYQVIGPSGNDIFLPAAGCKCGAATNGDGEVGYYWTSTVYHDYSSAESLFFYARQYDWYNDNRFAGLPVRAVLE